MNRLSLYSHICPTQTGSKLSPIRQFVKTARAAIRPSHLEQ